ncbi:MAG: hypothetical protein EB127_04545 [Alphaproteobacteria bacterium]|nr:hypothetical protein [Alphaproteobacteria bacterium]
MRVRLLQLPFTILLVTGSPTVTAGGALTALANATGSLGTCRVDSVTINKSNSSFVTMDISATGYPNVS